MNRTQKALNIERYIKIRLRVELIVWLPKEDKDEEGNVKTKEIQLSSKIPVEVRTNEITDILNSLMLELKKNK